MAALGPGGGGSFATGVTGCDVHRTHVQVFRLGHGCGK